MSIFPLSPNQFFETFRLYNTQLRLAQAFTLLIGTVALSFSFWDNRAAAKIVNGSLAVLWIWVGVAYLAAYLYPVLPVALGFAGLFVIQSGLFVQAGIVSDRLHYSFAPTLRHLLGAVILLYGMAVYVGLGLAFGHYYPATPTFGTPAPLVMSTIGLLHWTVRRPPWGLLAIPLFWCAVGSMLGWQTGLAEDYGLAASALSIVLLRSGKNWH